MKTTQLPQTVYSAAVLYMNRERHVLFCQMFEVSGLDPLTQDEVKARAVKECEAIWDEERNGPRAGYTLTSVAYSGITQQACP